MTPVGQRHTTYFVIVIVALCTCTVLSQSVCCSFIKNKILSSIHPVLAHERVVRRVAAEGGACDGQLAHVPERALYHVRA